MKTRLAVTILIAALLAGSATPAQAADPLAAYAKIAARIIAEQTSEASAQRAWHRLADLTDHFPGRFSGTAALDGAIAWSAERMRADGLADVRVEEVMVPHWVRGAEQAAIVSPAPQPLVVTAFGGSVGTGAQGITAPVVVVRDFAELDALGDKAKGKIIVYDRAFDEAGDPQTTYRAGRDYRAGGASRAARHGAVAALLRSVAPEGHRTAHTGATRYDPALPKIPFAALAVEDALLLQRMQDRGETPVVALQLGAQSLPEVKSGNVVGEWRGRERPDEVVVIGAHLDTWDNTPGALDDGGGCIAMWEALTTLKRLGLRPRRTIRLVLFTNEEFGGSGGKAYRQAHAAELDKHVFALEADSGVLPITGYNAIGGDRAKAALAKIATLLAGVGGTTIGDNFDGPDIAAWLDGGKIPGVSPAIDQHRYFHIHHTSADTVDRIVPAELARVAAAMAVLAYVVADLPAPLAEGGGLLP